MSSSLRFNKTNLAIIIGLLFLIGFLVWSDLPAVIQNFKSFRLLYLWPILLLSFTNYFFRFLKWQIYLRVLQIKISPLASVLIFLSGFAFAITPAKIGELYRSYLLKTAYNVPFRKAAPIVLMDRVTDLIAMLLIATVGVFVFGYGIWILGGGFALIVVLLVLIASRKISMRVIAGLEKVKFLNKFAQQIKVAWNSSQLMSEVKILFLAVFLSIFAWSAECYGFWLVFQGLNIHSITLLASFFIYAFSMILGALSMIPGGIGIQESSMAGLLILLSLNKADSVTATLIIRACTLWFAVVIGLISLALFYKLNLKDEKK